MFNCEYEYIIIIYEYIDIIYQSFIMRFDDRMDELLVTLLVEFQYLMYMNLKR